MAQAPGRPPRDRASEAAADVAGNAAVDAGAALAVRDQTTYNNFV